jgi:pimeloyl-ACP methyl ester carboxylesterase
MEHIIGYEVRMLRIQRKIGLWKLVVFVHGIGGYHSVFNSLVDHFLNVSTSGFVTLQYDLIGRGFSSPPKDNNYSEEAHLSQLLALLSDLSSVLPPPPYHFIGHSMGGCLATLFAAKHPHYVKSLTLLSPAGLMGYFPLGLLLSTPNWFKNSLRGTICSPSSQVQAWKSDFYSSKCAKIQERIDDLTNMTKCNPNAISAFWYSALQFPLRKIDESVKRLGTRKDFPILLLWAKQDKAVPMKPSYDRWLNYLQKPQSKTLINVEKKEDCVSGKSTASTALIGESSSVILENDDDNYCHLETKVYPKAAHGFLIEYDTIVNKDIFEFIGKHSNLNDDHIQIEIKNHA